MNLSESFIEENFRYLESLTSLGIRTDLSFMKRALSLIGNPQEKLKTIIVGGTNGKGSVVSFIGSILKTAGYRPGLYFSPHILDVRERIVADGKMISRADGAALISEIREKITGKKTAQSLELTYFEFITLMAYIHFAEKGFDPAVMEVGLGGRFDATNVGRPKVSIITNVSLDHTNILGDTEKEIALEKVEILPDGGALVVGRTSDKVKKLLKKAAMDKGAKINFMGEEFDCRPVGPKAFDYTGLRSDISGLRPGLLGAHQAENAAVALAAIELLIEMGYEVSEKDIRKGIRDTRLFGRVDRVSKRPELIFDVAHNPDAAGALVRYLKGLPEMKTAFVVGMMTDKDITGFLKVLDTIADAIFLVPLSVSRAASIKKLEGAAEGLKNHVYTRKSVGDGIGAARGLVGKSGMVVVCGSFYTIEEAWRAIKD